MKYFSVEEANRTLPLVQRIVADITAEFPAWHERVGRYEVVAGGSRADDGESEEQRRLRMEIEQIARRVNDYLDELREIGCVFKGFEEGLVDFYGRLEGRDVFWCWRLGEPRIAYWHEVDAGYAGRRPIPAEVAR